MPRKILRMIALSSFALAVVLGADWQSQAQDPKSPYLSIAPLDQYLVVAVLPNWPWPPLVLGFPSTTQHTASTLPSSWRTAANPATAPRR
jgi:hypothetical protein